MQIVYYLHTQRQEKISVVLPLCATSLTGWHWTKETRWQTTGYMVGGWRQNCSVMEEPTLNYGQTVWQSTAVPVWGEMDRPMLNRSLGDGWHTSSCQPSIRYGGKWKKSLRHLLTKLLILPYSMEVYRVVHKYFKQTVVEPCLMAYLKACRFTRLPWMSLYSTRTYLLTYSLFCFWLSPFK